MTRALGFLALAAVLLARATPLCAEPLQVAVSIPPQKYLLERIGREHVKVTVVLQPGHAPETYEPSPQQLAKLQSARLYFRIGVPFERAWLESLAGNGSGMQVIDCCADIVSPSAQDARGGDPHVWVDPMRAMQIAGLMRATLARVDPSRADTYASNFDALRSDLERLHRETVERLNGRRIGDFIVSHGSLGPFADAYGLVQIPLEYGGHSVGPMRLAEIVQLARDKNIRVILVQKQFSATTARTLAGEVGARLVEFDPLAEDYLAGMRAITAAVAEATR